jgi:hypothetical protein
MQKVTKGPRQVDSRSHPTSNKTDSSAHTSKAAISNNSHNLGSNNLGKESSSTDSLDSYLRDDTVKPSSKVFTKTKRPAPPIPSQNAKPKFDKIDTSQIKVKPEKSQGEPTVRRVVKQKTLHERLSYHYGDDVSMPIETDIDSVMDPIPNPIDHPHQPVRVNPTKDKLKILSENEEDSNGTFVPTILVSDLSTSTKGITPPTTISSKAIFIPPKEADSTFTVLNPNRQREIESLKKCSDTLLQTLEQVMEVTQTNYVALHSRGRDVFEEVLNDLPKLNSIIKKFASRLQKLLEQPEKEQQISILLQEVLDKYSLFHQYIHHLQKSMYALKHNEIEEGSHNTFKVLYKGVQLSLTAALQLIPPWLATVLEHAKSILLYTSEAHPDKESLTKVVQCFIQAYRNDNDSGSICGVENELLDPTPYHRVF